MDTTIGADTRDELLPGDVEPRRAAEDPAPVADVVVARRMPGSASNAGSAACVICSARDVRAGADVRFAGEREVADGRPAHVEAVRVLPVALVAVGGGDEDADPAGDEELDVRAHLRLAERAASMNPRRTVPSSARSQRALIASSTSRLARSHRCHVSASSVGCRRRQ